VSQCLPEAAWSFTRRSLSPIAAGKLFPRNLARGNESVQAGLGEARPVGAHAFAGARAIGIMLAAMGKEVIGAG
jgi:hypothetical protein